MTLITNALINFSQFYEILIRKHRIMNILTHPKEVLFSNWHFMRWLRLALGIYVGVQAIQFTDALAGMVSVFFLYQAITNTGCCGASGCSVPDQTNRKQTAE